MKYKSRKRRARDFNLTAGKWNSKDPILFEGGDDSLYSYALNDPINLVDPNGEDAFLTFELLVRAINSLANDDHELENILLKVIITYFESSNI